MNEHVLSRSLVYADLYRECKSIEYIDMHTTLLLARFVEYMDILLSRSLAFAYAFRSFMPDTYRVCISIKDTYIQILSRSLAHMDVRAHTLPLARVCRSIWSIHIQKKFTYAHYSPARSLAHMNLQILSCSLAYAYVEYSYL